MSADVFSSTKIKTLGMIGVYLTEKKRLCPVSSLTCCVVLVGFVLVSGAETSSSNTAKFFCFGSGDGVSLGGGRLGGGPGFCTARTFENARAHACKRVEEHTAMVTCITIN